MGEEKEDLNGGGGSDTPPDEGDRIAKLEAEIENLKSEKKSGTEARKEIQKTKRENSTLEDRLSSVEEAQNTSLENAKTSVMAALSGGDVDEAAKIQYEYDLLNMPDTTPVEVEARLKKASSMVERVDGINPLNTGIPTSSAPGMVSQKDKSFASTSGGQDLAKRLGMNFMNKDKK